MILTEVRLTDITIGRKRVPAFVGHHRCGWSTRYQVGNKTIIRKTGLTATPAYIRAKRLLTIHRRVCKVGKSALTPDSTNGA